MKRNWVSRQFQTQAMKKAHAASIATAAARQATPTAMSVISEDKKSFIRVLFAYGETVVLCPSFLRVVFMPLLEAVFARISYQEIPVSLPSTKAAQTCSKKDFH